MRFTFVRARLLLIPARGQVVGACEFVRQIATDRRAVARKEHMPDANTAAPSRLRFQVPGMPVRRENRRSQQRWPRVHGHARRPPTAGRCRPL